MTGLLALKKNYSVQFNTKYWQIITDLGRGAVSLQDEVSALLKKIFKTKNINFLILKCLVRYI